MLGFRDYFTPRQGYFSVFARATCALSVSQEYLGLEHGRPRFTQDFTSLALLRILLGQLGFAYRAITRYGLPFQVVLLALLNPKCSPTTPGSKLPGVASSVFARRYWRNLFDFFSSGY